jgi:hypothetical protein
MAQYPNFEDFMSLNFNPPPPTFAAPFPHTQDIAVGASHEVLQEQPAPQFVATQPPALHTSAPARDESIYNRLITLEVMIKWLYDNQLKLLDSTQRIISNQDRLEATVNATNVALSKLSDDFSSWMREVEGSESDTETTYEGDSSESEDEGDRYTDALDPDNFLSQLD